MADQLWKRVDELVDRARDLDDLREHRLGLLAARRWRALGRPVPEELLVEERFAAVMTMTAPLLLEKIRASLDGPVVLFKGPEVAARYPDPALRPYGDLDILVPDAHAAHETLKEAGFIEVGDPDLYVDIHHLRPLRLSPLPLVVEVHSMPKWIEPLEPPSTLELVDAAVASRIDVDGIMALRPDHHALVLAAHAWAHEPLARVLSLIDVAAMSEGLDREQLSALAESWRMERLWHTTLSATDALLADGNQTTPLPLKLWARNLRAARRRTVLESHLARWVSGFWALPLGEALRASRASMARAFRPAEGETWHEKLARMRLALRDASRPRSQHERALQDRRRD